MSRDGIKIFEIDEQCIHPPLFGLLFLNFLQGRFVQIASEEFQGKFLPRGVGFIEDGKSVVVGFMELHEL